jgi:hypothetical protein
MRSERGQSAMRQHPNVCFTSPGHFSSLSGRQAAAPKVECFPLSRRKMVEQLTDKLRQIMSLGECCRILLSSIQRCRDSCSFIIILKERLFSSGSSEMVNRFIATDSIQPRRDPALKMLLRLLAEFDKRMLNSIVR